MTRPIKVGDTVQIVMARAEVFDWQLERRFWAEIISMPAATGDLIYAQTGELVFALNPLHNEFVGMVKATGYPKYCCPQCEKEIIHEDDKASMLAEKLCVDCLIIRMQIGGKAASSNSEAENTVQEENSD